MDKDLGVPATTVVDNIRTLAGALEKNEERRAKTKKEKERKARRKLERTVGGKIPRTRRVGTKAKEMRTSDGA